MDLSTLSRIVGCPLPTELRKEYGAEVAPNLIMSLGHYGSGVEANSSHSGDEYSKGLELKSRAVSFDSAVSVPCCRLT